MSSKSLLIAVGTLAISLYGYCVLWTPGFKAIMMVTVVPDLLRAGTKQGGVQLITQHFCVHVRTVLLADLA